MMFFKRSVPTLCLFSLIGATLAGCGNGHDNSETVALVKKYGSVELVDGRAVSVSLHTKTRVSGRGANEVLPRLDKLPCLKALRVYAIRLSDENLRDIGALVNLRRLHLVGCNLDDNDLQKLDGMINLEELVITHTEVTDQGLRHFAKLTQLVHLDLSATRIRGPGLACLKEASGLEWLEVSNTQLDDSAMPHIVDNFKRLKRLSFNHTDVTPKGLMELAKLPWLVVSLPDDIVGPDDREMTSRDEREELLKERRKAKRELLAQYWSAHLKFRQEARAAGIDVPPASSDGVVYDQIQWLKSEK